MRFRWLPLLVGALWAGASSAAAQEPTGGLSGRVVDAVGGGGLAGATVALACAPEDAGPAARCSHVAVTDAEGRYAFSRLVAGGYRLTVRQPGYRARTIEVRLGGAEGARVSVALEVEPIELEPVWVTGTLERSFEATPRAGDAGASGAARLAVERMRQRRFLSADVRSVTSADVREAVTLGETDLFRALQRLPGVATRDEWSAELWTRGASWDATRVRFDGFPLYDPLHAFGLLGGVHPEIVGSATFHPGIQPVSGGGAAAALVDVRSRPAAPGTAGGVELSLASGRAFIEDRSLDDRLGLTLALRRTWIDGFMDALSRAFDVDDAEMPFVFWDVTGRADYALAPGDGVLEASVLLERDRVTGDVPDVLEATRAARGNRIARISWVRPWSGREARFTVGGSWFGERVDSAAPVDDEFSAPREPRRRTSVRHLRLEASLGPGHGRQHAWWSAGASLAFERIEYAGPPPFPVPYHPIDERVASAREITRAAAWVERRQRLAPRWQAELGLRAETMPAQAGGTQAVIAPGVVVRFTPSADVHLSAGAGRSFQTVQTAGPLGPWVGETGHWGNYWILAGDAAPLLENDIATVGFEGWLPDAWLVSAAAYVRRSSGVAAPDPRPGDARGRAIFLVGENAARGLELGARRISGRWTGSLGWTWSHSRHHFAGISFPAPADRPHVLDATLGYALSDGLLLTAAFTAMTGAPYRRALTGWLACGGLTPCDEDVVLLETAGSRRAADYRALDLGLDWSGRAFGARAGLFLQVRNVLGRDNDGAYRSTQQDCTAHACSPERPGPAYDEFAPGMPILPLIGFRVVF